MEEQKLNSFSIIIPTCERPNATIRAVNSALNQTYGGPVEVILVEDGSQASVKEKLDKYVQDVNDPRLKIIHHPQRMQRLVARNTGIKVATNDFLCHLDSDDEYLRTYLDSLNWAINEYPDYQCFHWGAIVIGLKGHRVREPFNLEEGGPNGEAMQRFQSGRIGLGSFAYKREVHSEIGYFPEIGHHDRFGDWAKEKFPEFLEWTGGMSCDGGKPLGNNWGDDFFLFFSITRKYKSKMLPFLHYIQNVRRSGFTSQDNDTILNRPNVAIL